MSAFVDRLASRLSFDAPAPTPGHRRCAAVAVVLHDSSPHEAPHVLLMKRNEREHDPWSGHISLPGGGYEPHDPHLLATSIRETREELGIDVSPMRHLGNLPPTLPMTAGPNGIQVTPFVFVTEAPVEAVCGPEAAAAFWLPLDLASSGRIDGHYLYPKTEMKFSAWQYEGHTIWGLTWRILGDLIERGR